MALMYYFETKSEANKITSIMREIIYHYGYATINDLYNIMGDEWFEDISEDYGWDDGLYFRSKPVITEDGYLLCFPDPEELDKSVINIHHRKKLAYLTNYDDVYIEDVIFNDPATIVKWSDGTKTVVKSNEKYDTFDPEKGLALAIAKKALGNKGSYYSIIRKYLKKNEE